MLYTEIFDLCSEIHTKHINTLRGQTELVQIYISISIYIYIFVCVCVCVYQWGLKGDSGKIAKDILLS